METGVCLKHENGILTARSLTRLLFASCFFQFELPYCLHWLYFVTLFGVHSLTPTVLACGHYCYTPTSGSTAATGFCLSTLFQHLHALSCKSLPDFHPLTHYNHSSLCFTFNSWFMFYNTSTHIVDIVLHLLRCPAFWCIVYWLWMISELVQIHITPLLCGKALYSAMLAQVN